MVARGVGVGRAGGRDGGEHHRVAVRRVTGGRRPRRCRGRRRCRAASAARPAASTPARSRSTTTRSGALMPVAEPLGEQVVRLPVGGLGRRVAGGRERRSASRTPGRRWRAGRRRSRAGRARGGRRRGGRTATTRCPRPALAARCRRTDPARVDPVAEEAEQGGQQGDGGGDREEHHERGGQADRGQHAEAGDGQGCGGDDDGAAGEDDGGTRGAHRVREGAWCCPAPAVRFSR